MQKSIKINMILNGIKSLMSVIFPLITFPYVSKILGVDNIGKYNFASSFVSYFILFASLGISTYAIREGAKIREDKDKIKDFCSELLSINFISMIISYLALLLLLLIVPKLSNYTVLILLFSLQIFFNTVGVEWVYSVYEDYLFITIRSIIFQVISLILLFVFVKSEQDLYIYAFITVFSVIGTNIINLIFSKKYCTISFTKKLNLKNHLKPIFVLFATILTITIYVNLDITILGFMTSDYTVGIYSVSVKIYTIIKNLIAAIIVVSIPRFSYMISHNKMKELVSSANEIYKTLITFLIPAIFGVIVLRREIILILTDQSYMQATFSLVILTITMYVCLGAYFYGQAILVPFNQESKVLKITIISALINVVLNFALIPFFGEIAAAVTTFISELFAFVFCKKNASKYVKMDNMFNVICKSILGSFVIVIFDFVFRNCIGYNFMMVIIMTVLSVILYVVIEYIFKNEIILSYYDILKKKIIKN